MPPLKKYLTGDHSIAEEINNRLIRDYEDLQSVMLQSPRVMEKLFSFLDRLEDMGVRKVLVERIPLYIDALVKIDSGDITPVDELCKSLTLKTYYFDSIVDSQTVFDLCIAFELSPKDIPVKLKVAKTLSQQ